MKQSEQKSNATGTASKPTPRQYGAAAGWAKQTELANPFSDPADRAEWLEGWRDTQRSFGTDGSAERAKEKRE